MMRWLFHFAAGLSLLLLIAISGLWIRSYFAWEGLNVLQSNWLDSDQHRSGSFRIAQKSGTFEFLYMMEVLNFAAKPVEIQEYFLGPMDAATFRLRVHDGIRWSWEPVRITGAESEMGYGWPENSHGFGWRSNGSQTKVIKAITWELFLPGWLLFAVTAIFPVIWVIQLIRVRRLRLCARQGFCQHCGYDLRATPGRCPECGAMPENLPETPQ